MRALRGCVGIGLCVYFLSEGILPQVYVKKIFGECLLKIFWSKRYLLAESCFHVDINKSFHMNIDSNSDFCKIKISEKSLHHCLRCLTCLFPTTLLKKRLWHRCFSVNFEKFLRTLFLQNTSGRLLLYTRSK